MSIPSFQQALCDLIASPQLCLALRANPEATLAGYQLSARERKRLMEVVWQRGMSTNCTLYRSNRVTPIYTLLTLTCRALGDQLRALLDEFWDAKEYQDGQFHSEVERFAAFLSRRIAAGGIRSPFAAELLQFELALNALEFAPRRQILDETAKLPAPQPDTPCRLHPLARVIRFRHDPDVLLEAAASGALPSDMPEQDALVVVSVIRDSAPTIVRLSDDACDALFDAAGIVEPLIPRRVPALAAAGLLVAGVAAARLSA
jgi:hypothetical protein